MYAMTETSSENSHKKMTFVERVRQRDGSAVHLVKTYDENEEPCWFLLKANERSLVKLERTSYEDVIDLTQYGEIVASGWGHEPDERALKKFTNSET